MMLSEGQMAKFDGVRGKFRAIWLAPLLAFLALGAWAFASPIGAGPDDDFHLVSTWCANGGGEHCTEGDSAGNRTITSALEKLHCYAYDEEKSAACQEAVLHDLGDEQTLTRRGNFTGAYPPLYYATMGLFSGDNIIASAVVMRLANVALFVGLATALFALLPVFRRGNLAWGWLVTTIPLGVFLIASNNPSGWAIVGVGSAWLALLGYFETQGRRRIALGVLFIVSVLIAAGSRSDGAFYAAGAIVTVLVLKAVWEKRFVILSLLPLVGLAISIFFFFTAGQTGSGTGGFSTASREETPEAEAALGALGLLAFNILNLPGLWTGVFGNWGLGWLDTAMPAIVLWASTAAFIGAGFVGLAAMSWRKAIALIGTGLVLFALPLWVLYQSSAAVGTYLQARYLLPLIVVFALVLLFVPTGRSIEFSKLQRWAIGFALVIANFVALQVNIRRYVTGVDAPGVSLDAGAEWWWQGVPFGPNAVWIVGSLAFAALVVLVVREVSQPEPQARPMTR